MRGRSPVRGAPQVVAVALLGRRPQHVLLPKPQHIGGCSCLGLYAGHTRGCLKNTRAMLGQRAAWRPAWNSPQLPTPQPGAADVSALLRLSMPLTCVSKAKMRTCEAQREGLEMRPRQPGSAPCSCWRTAMPTAPKSSPSPRVCEGGHATHVLELVAPVAVAQLALGESHLALTLELAVRALQGMVRVRRQRMSAAPQLFP